MLCDKYWTFRDPESSLRVGDKGLGSPAGRDKKKKGNSTN
jgi:hypothetical protein